MQRIEIFITSVQREFAEERERLAQYVSADVLPTERVYGLTAQKLLEPHNLMPNNPLLAEPMYFMGYIEKVGTGTEDIVQKCVAHGLKKPEYYYKGDDFRVIIWRPERAVNVVNQNITHQTTPHVAQKSGVKSSQKSAVKSAVKILEEIKQNPQITRMELSIRLDLSIRAIDKNLNQLKSAGHLRRIGPDKGGHWEVVE